MRVDEKEAAQEKYELAEAMRLLVSASLRSGLCSQFNSVLSGPTHTHGEPGSASSC